MIQFLILIVNVFCADIYININGNDKCDNSLKTFDKAWMCKVFDLCGKIYLF
jgi:hypothetical protein